MAVVAAAGRHRGNHGMAQSPKYAFAVAAVIQRVFPEGFRQSVARTRRYHGDAEVGTNSLAVGAPALPPLRRRFICLIDGSQDPRAGDGIGTEGIEEVVPELRSLRRAAVAEVQFSSGCAGGGRNGGGYGGRSGGGLGFSRGGERCRARRGDQQSDNLEGPLHVKFSLPGIPFCE